MATTGVVNSTLFALYAGDGTYTKIAHSTDASISFSHEPRDITSKDSAGYRQLLEGLRSWSASGSFLVALDATYGYEELYAAWVARSVLTVRFSTQVSGDQYYQGTAYISSLELSSPGAEDNATFSLSLEGTGALTAQALT